MIHDLKEGLQILRFPNLVRFREIRHGIFTRLGGVSSKPFDSLNLSQSVGDTAENVEKNRQILFRQMGKGTMVYLEQTHSDRIRTLTKEMEPFVSRDNIQVKGDAIITDLFDKNLVIRTADCQTVFLFDPVRKVVANIHSGWRGSILNIVGKTVKKMKDVFQSEPCNIIAGIGPSLGPCCAEFIHFKKEIPQFLWKYKDSGNRFDFWKLTRDQLVLEGVLPENLVSSNLCTRCRTDLFFSYRGEKITGRFAGAIGLRK